MMLSVREIDPKDVPHLFCSDPRLEEEVDAVNRSMHRLDETVSMWTYMEPKAELTGEEVAA